MYKIVTKDEERKQKSNSVLSARCVADKRREADVTTSRHTCINTSVIRFYSSRPYFFEMSENKLYDPTTSPSLFKTT